MEDLIRLDRDPMQYDPARPGKAIADVPAIHVRYEIQRNFFRQSKHREIQAPCKRPII